MYNISPFDTLIFKDLIIYKMYLSQNVNRKMENYSLKKKKYLRLSFFF